MKLKQILHQQISMYSSYKAFIFSRELRPQAHLSSFNRSSCLMREVRQSEALIWGWGGLAGPCYLSWTVWLSLTHISATVCACVYVIPVDWKTPGLHWQYLEANASIIRSIFWASPGSLKLHRNCLQQWEEREKNMMTFHQILMQMYILACGYSL